MSILASTRLRSTTFAIATTATAVIATVGSGLGLAGASAAGSFQGRVTAYGGLVERTAPSAYAGRTGTGYARGTVITIDCALNGTTVDGNHRWYKIRGKDAWVSARYVANIGAAPYACTAGDWSYHPTTSLIVRQGPSTADRKVGSLAKGQSFNTRWIATRGQTVNGNPKWLAVESTTGNRGWVSASYVREDAR